MISVSPGSRLPTATVATIVPWPTKPVASSSTGVALSPQGSNQASAADVLKPRHLRQSSGCSPSTPLSMMATTVPCPVAPAAHSSGAPITCSPQGSPPSGSCAATGRPGAQSKGDGASQPPARSTLTRPS